MKLEVNSSDKKANLTNLKLKSKKMLASLGILSGLVLFSGCIKEQQKNITPPDVNTKNTISTEDTNYKEQNEITIEGQVYEETSTNEIENMFISKDTIVEIPQSVHFQIAAACQFENLEDPITVGHLESLKGIEGSLFIVIHEEQSLDWLKYCKNLEYLTIVTYAEDTSIFQTIKELPNLKSLNISSDSCQTFNRKDFKFVENAPNIEELTLEGFYTEPEFVESLTSLKYLSIEVDNINPEIDYSKLTFLDELSFTASGPYDVAIEFTDEDYYALINNNVTILTNEDTDIDIILEINKKLDAIVSSLNLTENSTDQEKLDAILIYVLDNLTYDQNISNMLIMDNISSEEVRKFYSGGNLYGALELDTAICGNYAALVDALAERVGLDMHFLISESHAWNLTTIDQEEYYVDATWLDDTRVINTTTSEAYDNYGNLVIIHESEYIDAADAIEQGLQSELSWYMEDPTNLPETYNQKESHETVHMPTFIKINDSKESHDIYQVPETENTEASKKATPPAEDKYQITIGNKKWIISAGAAIGILSGISGGAIIHHQKKKDAEKRRRQRYKQYLQQQKNNHLPSYSTYDSFDANNKYY